MAALAQKQSNSRNKKIVRNVNTLVASRMGLMFEIAREAASIKPETDLRPAKKPRAKVKR